MGMGTNRLNESAASTEFVREAVRAGIGLIDTAHLYTGGSSETTIGMAIGRGSQDVVVATKGGFQPGEGRPDVLREQIEASLRRLRTDRIFLYYLHRVDPETPLETTLRVLAEYHARGVIANVGLSQVGIDEIERAR